jgi:hypothetical protein
VEVVYLCERSAVECLQAVGPAPGAFAMMGKGDAGEGMDEVR